MDFEGTFFLLSFSIINRSSQNLVMEKFVGNAGHRPSSASPVFSGSVLKSLLQKSVRRGEEKNGIGAVSFFFQILLDKKLDKYGKPFSRANFSNLVNRLAVILSEDLFDINIISPVCTRIKLLDNIRGEMDKGVLSSEKCVKALSLFYEIAFMLLNAAPQCRSVSYLKNVMKNGLPSSLKKDAERVMINGNIDVIESFSPLIFNPDLYCKDGVSLKKGSVLKIKKGVWSILLSKCSPENRNAVKSLMELWEKRFKHREHFVWILQAILIVVDKDKHIEERKVSLREVSLEEAEALFFEFAVQREFKIPAWAIDKHCGKFSGGEGLRRFLVEGIVMKKEYFVVSVAYKDYYLNVRFKSIEEKKRKKEKRIENDLPPSSVVEIEAYLLSQLPCGGKPASFLIRSKDGKNVYVKRCKARPDFQLRVDKMKPAYGLMSNGFRYYPEGFLVCKDIGLGRADQYEKKMYKGKDVLDAEKALSAAVPVKHRLEHFDELIEEFIRIGMFRKVVGSSDSHMRNVLYVPESVEEKPRLLSVDEMSKKPGKFVEGCLSRSLFNVLSKKYAEKVDEYVKENKEKIMKVLFSWKEIKGRSEDEEERLDKLISIVS